MAFEKLLKIQNKGIMPEYFPTPMQAFIFRNWGMIDKKKLADVLKTTVENVETEAKRMGLEEQGDVSVWMEKGYITIIRSNWHLLPYNQLLELMGWDEDKLNLALKEEDFLDIKLGGFKPECEEIEYKELNREEIQKTEKIRNYVEKAHKELTDIRAPFDFWSEKQRPGYIASPKSGQIKLDNGWGIVDNTNNEFVKAMAERFALHMKENWNIDLSKSKENGRIELSLIPSKADEYHEISIKDNVIQLKAGSSAGILRGLYRLEDLCLANGGAFLDKADYKREPRFEARYIYSFSALYDGALDVDSRTWCPDGLLEQYAKTGVNGIWLQGILYRLTEFPFDPKVSEGWQTRQKNLRDFVLRAKSYGIKIYFYINEPRAMLHTFFEKYPALKGSSNERYTCMCIMQKENQEYLSSAIEKLCRAVPDLGGFFTISMSENPTHCRSIKFDKMCPVCENVPQAELVSTVNRLVAEGAARVSDSIKVIAWDWGWSPASNLGIEYGNKEKCISKIPSSVAIMCQRDKGIPFERGGIKDSVVDYSICVDGISDATLSTWEMAKKYGHQTAVKLQINNSWECSTTPYLPVYGTLINHINSLIATDVNHLMLSWTLGGYPSPNIKIVSESFFIENGKHTPDYSFALKALYGADAPAVKEATDLFCEAFKEFPFNIGLLYAGPQNAGVSNPLYHKPTGYCATMTCFAYDDLTRWRSIYPEDVVENQFKKVSDIWEKGLLKLENIEGEIKDIAYVSYSLFKSSYNQIRFVRLRNSYEAEKSDYLRQQILELVRNEKQLATKIYAIMKRRPEVGFEAANHYYYSADTVLEKIVNCSWLEEYYG